MVGLVSKPDVAIRPSGDAHADPEKGQLIFRDDSIRRERSNFARRAFAEPDVAVWPRRDECRIAQARGPGVADGAVRSDPGDFAAVGKREPKGAVFADVIANGWLPPRIGTLLTSVVWAAALPAGRASTVSPQVSWK